MLEDLRELTRVVTLAQSGERQALDRLLQALQAPLHGYLRGLLRDEHMAEDVLQDVLVQVCRSLFWLREPEALYPWALRIASRAGLRRLRRERRWSWRGLDASGVAEPAVAGESADERDGAEVRLPELVAAASPASRAVLLLHYGQGLSLDEVAAALGLPVGTVKSRLAYGLESLRRRTGPSRRDAP